MQMRSKLNWVSLLASCPISAGLRQLRRALRRAPLLILSRIHHLRLYRGQRERRGHSGSTFAGPSRLSSAAKGRGSGKGRRRGVPGLFLPVGWGLRAAGSVKTQGRATLESDTCPANWCHNDSLSPSLPLQPSPFLSLSPSPSSNTLGSKIPLRGALGFQPFLSPLPSRSKFG